MDKAIRTLYEAMIEIAIITLTNTNDDYIMEMELRKIISLEELLSENN